MALMGHPLWIVWNPAGAEVHGEDAQSPHGILFSLGLGIPKCSGASWATQSWS